MTFDEQAWENWKFKNDPGRFLREGSRTSGNRFIHMMTSPSFDPICSYELYPKTWDDLDVSEQYWHTQITSYGVIRTIYDHLKHRMRLTNILDEEARIKIPPKFVYDTATITSEQMTQIYEQFRELKFYWLHPSYDLKRHGKDGTSYLVKFGDFYGAVHLTYEWHSSLYTLTGWESLKEVFDDTINMFEDAIATQP